MRPFAVACPLSLALGASGPAAADDSSKGVQLPGWQAEPGGSVTVTAAAIVLDGQTATATLTLAGGRPAPVRLSLTTPRFGWLGEGEPYPDRQFPELAVRLDGNRWPWRQASGPSRAPGRSPDCCRPTTSIRSRSL